MKRAWRWAVVLLLAVPFAWWALNQRLASAPPQAAPAADPLPPLRPMQPPPPFEAPPSAPLPQPARPAVPPQIAASSVAARPDDHQRMEVCGHGRLPEHEIERVMPDEVQQETLGRLAQVLLRGSDREQVVGWLLSDLMESNAAFADTFRACNQDIDCVIKATNHPRSQPSEGQQALVRLAERSADAWVYRAAVAHVCRSGNTSAERGASPCARLSPSQWQQRDPSDAAPWLWQAEIAAARQDAAAVDAALAQAARLPQLSSPVGQLYGPLLAHADVRALPPLSRVGVLMGVIGVTAALPIPVHVVTSHCTTEKLMLPERRERCDALARLFVDQAPTLMQRAVGARLGERLGWPAERVRELEDEKLALQQVRNDELKVKGILSCAGIADVERFFRDQAAAGEVAALRKQLQSSGRSTAEWAAQARTAIAAALKQ